MTLVMTLVSRKLIMQCADFRATDTKTGKYQDRTQKQVIIVRQGWSAVVSFTGVAEANYKRTDKWLREAVEGLDRPATFNDLLARLKQAERWLARVPAEHRHHSFIAAGFIGLQPILGLVSNFERLDATPLSDAALTLGIQTLRPGQAKLFRHGMPKAVAYPDRLRLTALLARGADHDELQRAAAEINAKSASSRDAARTISVACFTTVLTADGRSSSMPHGIQIAAGPASPLGLDQDTLDLLRGAGIDASSAHVGQILTVNVPPGSEQYYRNRLSLYPNDSETLSNFAGWLAGQGRNREAEQRYQEAIAAGPGNPHTLTSYAAFLWKVLKRNDDAERVFEDVRTVDPTNAFFCTEYAHFARYIRHDFTLAEELYVRALEYNRDPQRAVDLAKFARDDQGDLAKALGYVEQALEMRPDFAPALVTRGVLHALLGELELARADLESAVSHDATSAAAAAALASILHMAGAEADELRAAHERAIGFANAPASATANFAQFLLIHHEKERGLQLIHKYLDREDRTPSADLETLFCLYAFDPDSSQSVEPQITELLDDGIRSVGWPLLPLAEAAIVAGYPAPERLRELAIVITSDPTSSRSG